MKETITNVIDELITDTYAELDDKNVFQISMLTGLLYAKLNALAEWQADLCKLKHGE